MKKLLFLSIALFSTLALEAKNVDITTTYHYKNIPTKIKIGDKHTLPKAYGRPFTAWELALESGDAVAVDKTTVKGEKSGTAKIKVIGTLPDKTIHTALKTITVE